MTATLIDLLLRLSEAGGGARLWGAAARPHYGPAFDRLLAAGVLEERPPAEEWPVCDDCDCGLDARPVLAIGERRIAACPLDAGRDALLDAQDLRSFAIDESRLALECLGGDPGAICEPLPRLWVRLDAAAGHVGLTFRRGVAEDPALAFVLQGVARGAPLALATPRPSANGLLRLQGVPGLSVLGLGDAIKTTADGRVSLDPNLGRATRNPSPRLQVSLPGEAVLVDGEPRSVPMQRFRLLIMLIDAWEKGLPLRGGMIEEAFSGRSAADLVRELRSDLAKGSVDSRAIHGWVQTVRSPAAYRLALARTEVEVIR